VRSVEDFKAAFVQAISGDELTTIVAKVEAVGPKVFVTGLTLLENRFEFARHVGAVTSGE